MITPEERAADEAVIARAMNAEIDDIASAVFAYNDLAKSRWPAYVEALREAEARMEKLAAECEAHIARLDDTIMDRAEATQLRAENAKLKAALEEIREAASGDGYNVPNMAERITGIVERVTAAQE